MTQTLEFVVGSDVENSPIAGTPYWESELFRYSVIRAFAIDGIAQYQSTPNPFHLHNYVDEKITRLNPTDGTPCNFEVNQKISITITSL